jgi:hypothetical protein
VHQVDIGISEGSLSMRRKFFFTWITFATATILSAAVLNTSEYSIQVMYIIFLIYIYRLSSVSDLQAVFSILPYRNKDMVGIRQFLLLFVIISTAAAPYDISKYGRITYGSVACVLIAALISFDVFLLKVNLKGRDRG